MVDPVAPQPLTSVGTMPPEAWVFAFVKGARASVGGGGAASPSDVAWADMSDASLVVVLGRDGRPFRTRERRQLTALARIADNRWVELVTRSAPALTARRDRPGLDARFGAAVCHSRNPCLTSGLIELPATAVRS